MILQKELKNFSAVYGVPPDTIDKDWVLGHVLNALFSLPEVKENFVFKGGTCLHKCYFDSYRFSEDLDFTLLQPSFCIDKSFLNRFLNIAENNSGIRFNTEIPIKNQIHNDVAQGYEIELPYWGANHKPNQKVLQKSRWLTSIKIDLSFSEKLVSEPVLLPITHLYSDAALISSVIPCYSIHEVLGEKLRALVQRNRPRDIYDIWYIASYVKDIDFNEVARILKQKSQNKGIDISSELYFVNETKSRANRRAWENSMAH